MFAYANSLQPRQRLALSKRELVSTLKQVTATAAALCLREKLFAHANKLMPPLLRFGNGSNLSPGKDLGRPSRRRFRTPPARSNVTSKLHLGRPGFEGHIYYFFRLRGMLYHGRKKERGGARGKAKGQNDPLNTADKIAEGRWEKGCQNDTSKTADKIAEGRWKKQGVKMTP